MKNQDTMIHYMELLSFMKFKENMRNGTVSLPAFIKPKDGSSSINAYKVENLEDRT